MLLADRPTGRPDVTHANLEARLGIKDTNEGPDINDSNETTNSDQETTSSHEAAAQDGGEASIRDSLAWAARAMLMVFCSIFSLMTIVSLLLDDHR